MKLITCLAALIILTVSCSKPTEEEQRAEERQKLEEYLNKTTTLTFYKALKVALKSSADPSGDPETSEAAATIIKLGLRGMSLATDSTQSITFTEVITSAHKFYAARDVLIKKDEDDFPTILDNIRVISAGQKQEPLVIGGMTYDNNFEHVILGLLWTISVKAPPEFEMYELHKIDESHLPMSSLKLAAGLSKALAYSTKDFHWKALDQSAAYIVDVENNKARIVNDPTMKIPGMDSGEQSYYELHLLGLAMHGLSHLGLEHHEEAMTDFEGVLEDAEKAGIENELVWLIAAYVHISKEEMDKALVDLDKLEHSPLTPESEKKAIREAKEYIQSRESDKAFTTVRDKIAIYRICFNLVQDRLKEQEQLREIGSMPEGKRMYELQDRINTSSGDIEKLSGLDADTLSAQAKGFVKDLLGK